MKTEQARAGVDAQQAEVQRLQEQFDRHTMFAPFDGYVSAEHTEVGQWVMQGDPVAEIVELNEVDVEIAVVEDFVANLNTSVEGARRGRRRCRKTTVRRPRGDHQSAGRCPGPHVSRQGPRARIGSRTTSRC